MSETRAEPKPPLSRLGVGPGDLIAGKYEVDGVLAEGGMGIIVSAQHRQLKRRVALKFLVPELRDMHNVVARFLKEAQAMTAIQNEHVARVLDVGTTADAAPYMVMEYLEGADLAKELDRRERIPPIEVVEYVLQAMEALAEAHVRGFVHRDLKPSNLFVTRHPDGSPLVKVLDFGISKVQEATRSNPDLFPTAAFLGSPLYMSPEQIRDSKNVDHRADIWTLGVIMHELISGRPPFEGDTVPAVLEQIVQHDPSGLAELEAQAPAGLSEVVRKCLQRERDDRYANVAELAVALKPYATRDGLHSIEKIERVIAHHQPVDAPVDLRISTPPKGLTPVGVALLPPSDLLRSAPVRISASLPPVSLPPVSEVSRRADSFGKYRLLAVLGRGGMSEVSLAALDGPEGLGFSKLVVVKRLRADLTSDPDFVSMLVDEGRIAAKLSHPNVVRTHEVGVIENEYYLAMQFLDGEPLSRLLLRAPPLSIPLSLRLGIVCDLLAGLHYAHELTDYDGSKLGVVHRDVTPQNVFVTYDGQVKVVDFGIAKARGRTTMTAHGVVKGKVAYMAPEQAATEEVDRRADVFAVGVILWELLTGERLWKGIDDIGIMQKLSLDQIRRSPRAVRPDVPEALDAIVSKALARRPGGRYENAQAFKHALKEYIASEDLRMTTHELAAWVSDLGEERRRRMRDRIDAQLSALRELRPIRLIDLRDAERGDPGSDAPPSSGRVELSEARRPAARWGFPLLVATIAIVMVLGVLAVRRALDGAALSAATKPSTAAPPDTSSIPTAPTVSVTLTSTIPDVEFVIDEGPRMKAPVAITVPRSSESHRIVASAPGYRSEMQTTTFASDVSLNITLTAQPSTRTP